MSTSKHIDKICIAAVAIVLALTILFMCSGSLGLTVLTKAVKYEKSIFDTSYVHQIDIVMNDWDGFLESCENEEYGACVVVVDGTKHTNTAIRAKGNTSLSSVKASGSQRYSFKLEFDHFDDAGSLDGLDKLCLNNLIQDNTMMKDYLVYLMMNDFGADSPLCSFVYLTVNGEDWGLYLAVEGVEDSFLTRNYGTEFGELYKPDSLSFGGGRGNGRNFNMDDLDLGGSKSNEDSENSETQESQTATQPQESRPSESSGNQGFPFSGQMPNGGEDMPEPPDFGGGFPGGMPGGGEMPEGFDFSQMPGGGEMPEGFDFSQMPGGVPNGAEMPDGFDFGGQNTAQPTTDANAADGSTSGNDAETKESGKRFSFGGFGGMGSDDVKLKYIDDDPDSYPNIFDSAKTTVNKSDKARLIASLKKLSAYEDLESVLDMDEVLRYFVVHNFVCNGDSYTGAMIHNYYLHEKDGKLGMIPWDYNLAYGTFQGGNASGTVNTSIDSPLSGGNMDDRPMLGWIFSDESYTEQYHALFSEFIEKWFSNGKLETLIADTTEMIRPYVEKDPTKFCTTEDFDKAVAAISQFVSLRAEAVSRQLSGDDTAVETGDLDLSVMGTMGGSKGGGMGGMSKDFSGKFDVTSMVTLTDKDGNKTTLSAIAGKDVSIESVTLSDGTTVKLSETDMKDLMKLDLSEIVSATDKDGNKIDLSAYTVSFNRPSGRGSRSSDAATVPEQGGDSGDTGARRPGSTAEAESQPADNSKAQGDKPETQSEDAQRSGSSRPSMPGGSSFSPSSTGRKSSEATFWIWIGVSVLVLAAGLIFAVKKKD